MKRLTQQASSTDQANAINNLRDKTQGLSYENNIVGLTGSSGGFLSGTKRAMTWDAQGNLVIDGKVTFRGADLQTTLDGKQAKGDYVMTPTFNTYKQNTVEVLEKLQPKGDYALRDELAKTSGVLRGEIDKVSNSLIGYQLTDNYNKKTDFVLGGDTNTERGSVGLARALVRDSNSALTINYDNDFKGGVNLNASGGFRVRGNMDVGGGFTVGGKPFPAGPAGPAGPIGTMGSIGFTGQPGPAGSIGPQGPIGTMGSMGPAGSMGPLMDKALYLRASNDSFHGLAYGSAGDGAKWGIDGPVLWGNSNGALAAGGLNGPIALTWDKNKNVNVRGNMDVGGEFTVGGKPFTGGPTGPQGPQGPIGTMGSMGFTGQTGPIGTMGSIGFTGQTGPIGTRGSTGLQGLQGFQGPQGPIGTMGSIGPASVFNNAMNDKELRFRGPDDSNHYIAYKNDIDGVRVQGNKGGQLGSLNKTALTWDAENNVFVNATSNPIKFSSVWSNFPDNKTNNSEISNDTGAYKKLMIVGNKSGGAERRVGIWDRLDVHGNLGVDGDMNVGGAFTVGGKPFTGGSQGLQGIQGIQGLQGPIGTMGSMGFTGQTGPIGTMGSIGFTGQTGPIGLQGLQGFQGPQGPQGPIGTMGSIGPASVFNNAMNDKELRFRGPDDSNHYIAYKNDIDGVRVQGNKGGQLGSLNKTALNWDADNNVYVNNNVFVNSTSNPIQFSSTWSNFPDKNPKNSEISNDTDTYKKLMIVGNKSAGAERRVGIWDRLDVHGNLGVDGKIDVAGDAKFGKVVLGSTLYVNDKSQFLGDAKFGNVALDGTLYVHNKSQFVGDTNFGGNITVNGKPLTDYNKQVDFVLGGDTGTERGPVGSARALVRDNKSGLTINYNNDFTGGVDLNASGGFRVKGDMNVSGRMLSKYTHSPYTDVFGNDIKSINNSNWDNCQIACNSEPACKGFNFENKAWPNLAGTCWLKNNVVNKSNNADWHIFTKNY
jgi:hypothetical protein